MLAKQADSIEAVLAKRADSIEAVLAQKTDSIEAILSKKIAAIEESYESALLLERKDTAVALNFSDLPPAYNFEELEEKKEEMQVDDLVDVKFYIPEDKVRAILSEDTTLNISFPPEAMVQFFEPKDSTVKITDMDAYVEPKINLEKIKAKQALKVSESSKEELILNPNYRHSIVYKPQDTTAHFSMDTIFTDTAQTESINLSEYFSFVDEEPQVEEIEQDEQKDYVIIDEETVQESLEEIMLPKNEVTMKIPDIIVLFNYDRAVFGSDEKNKLQPIVDFMKQKPNLRFEVIGHTDSKGTDLYNSHLSVKRAQIVVDYLASQGIDEYRLIAIGKGEFMPIAPNANPDGSDNPEGRRLNRRVEFKAH